MLALWVAALLTLWLGGIEKAVYDVGDLHRAFQEQKRKTEIADKSKEALEGLQDLLLAEDAIPVPTETEQTNALALPKVVTEGALRGEGDAETRTNTLVLQNVVTPGKQRVLLIAQREKAEQEKKRQKEANESQMKVEADANDAKEATEQLKEKFKEGVAFKLFGCEFPILPALAPSIWMALLVMMFIYIAIVRKRVFRALNWALRIEREHFCSKPRERLSSVPWWLDPLPLTSSQGESHDLDLAVGWRPRPVKCSALALVTVLAVFVSASFVLLANQRMVRSCEDTEFRKEAKNLRTKQWHVKVAKVVPYVLLGIGFSLLAYWRRPIPVSSHFAGEPSPRELSQSITRRRFLNAGLSGTFGLVGLVCTTHFVSWLDNVVPHNRNRLLAKLGRIRQRRQTVVGKSLAAYMNDSSGALRVHFSSPKGAFRFPKAPKNYSSTEIAFAKFKPEVGGKRIALLEVSWALELKAMEIARNEGNDKRVSDACDILLCAVRHNLLYAKSSGMPSFRLYDLLAGLSVRGNTDHLEKMRALLAQSTFVPMFGARMETWSNPNARWRKRWTGKRRVWIASIADDRENVAQKKVLRLSLKA